jgi:hypothetical protein
LDFEQKGGLRFYHQGQSTQGRGDSTSVAYGILSATQPDAWLHNRGDMLSGIGNVGGDVFAVGTARLLGMMVGSDLIQGNAVVVPAALIWDRLQQL